MTDLESELAPPVPKLRWYQFRMSSLLWFTVGIALLMAALVQTARYQMLDQKRRVAERQVEELTKVLPKEIQPAWLTQVSAEPGNLFRGSLPKGDWRLAVYFWNGAGPRAETNTIAVPPGLAPLVAQRLPNPDDVEIRMSEASLPPGVTYNGKAVDIAFNIDTKDTRPAQRHGATLPLPPLLLSGDPGITQIYTNAPTDTAQPHVLICRGDLNRIGNHYLVLVEPVSSRSLKPQIGTDEVPDILP